MAANLTLLIENRPDDAALITGFLRRADPRAHVHVAEDGAKAIAYLAGEGDFADRSQYPLPAVILLDLGVGASGLAVLEWRLPRADMRGVPVVLLTSSKFSAELKHAYSLGAKSHLLKPVTLAALADALGALAPAFEGPVRVLLIDDSAEDRQAAINLLKLELPTVVVRELTSSEDFESAVAEGDFDVVVSDFHMKGWSGLERLRVVKSRWPDCPVITLTGTATKRDLMSALHAGFDDYVLKDQRDLPRLPAAVRSAIGKAKQRHALAVSETRYRRLFESATDGILILDWDSGEIVDVNPFLTELLGSTRDDLLGKKLWDIAPLSGIAATESAFSLLREKEFLHSADLPIEIEGRGRIHVEFASNSYLVDGTRVVQCHIRDITERRRADELQAAIYEIAEAAQQSAKVEDLLASIHRVVGRLMDARNLYIALYHPRSELLSFPYHVDEQDEPIPSRRLRRGLTEYVLRTGKPLLATPEVFAELCRRGETELVGAPSVDWIGVPLIAGDRTLGVLVVQTYTEGTRYGKRELDILAFVSRQVALAIERKSTEEQLRLSEDRFKKMAETIHDVFWMSTPAVDRILYVNPAFEKVFGYPCESLYRDAKVWVRAIHPDDRGRVADLMEEQIARGGDLEYRIVRQDGSVRWLWDSAMPIRDELGNVALVVGVARDMTQRHMVEEELRQAQKLEMIGKLAGGVAHNFNNLLQAMLSQTQLLRTQSAVSDKAAAVAGELEQQIRQGAALTRQLLLFSRQETTRISQIDLNEVVRDASRMLSRLVPANVAFDVRLHPLSLSMAADRTQLEQALVNLVVNASEAMPTGGHLTIRTGREDAGWVWFTVEDTGRGVPAEMRERIFEPFFTTKETGKGTGLGLSVVRTIVDLHRGRVAVDSTPGHGATFRVVLPGAPSDASPVVEASEQQSEPSRGTGERILVVEDEDAVREGLCEVIAALGYRVVAKRSGEEASALPPEPAFDVLLTDYMLPGIPGTELAGQLRARWSALKVILMSGYAPSETTHLDTVTGNIRFLQKPFDMDTLARELRVVLDGPTR
jgi:PAS domain S-box-containing protein